MKREIGEKNHVIFIYVEQGKQTTRIERVFEREGDDQEKESSRESSFFFKSP